MAVIVRWSEPRDSNWTDSRVYRANSKTGSYTLLATITIGTFSYTDDSGSSSFFYKVSFWDGVNESSLSDPVQGDTTPNYCDLVLFRKITPFSKNEINDADVIGLMRPASIMVHRKIMTKHKLERDLVGPVDGSNKIFYVKQKAIGDSDMDSDVDISDIQVYYATFDANNRLDYGSAQTVSAVDAQSGNYTVSTAPTTITAEAGLYVTYYSTVEDLDYTSVREAATYMLGHLVSLKIRGEAPNYSQIREGFLRPGMTGMVSTIIDPWQHPYLKAALEIIHDIIGKGKDGIGFSRVDAEAH